MKKLSIIALLITLSVLVQAQNSFTFSCNKDTVVNCSQSCFTIKAKIPNVKANSGTYTVVQNNAGGCFNPPVPPDLPGLPTNLTIDDKYSDSIDLPFTFPFWGLPYNRVIISANGLISFDVSNALLTTDYGILESGATGLSASAGNPANLPNVRYDKAIIMGVYSDIDPSETTSPTQQTKYEVLGTAPHRKWVVTYYKIPMFSTTCSNQIENTYQMVLYEGIGIVDVFVYSKEICTSWNQGRGMIGMQDFDRVNGIMAPGRAASDAPWGSANMNETWRFIPASGASLLKRVELFTSTGTLIAVGTTTDLGDGNLEATFPNVCTNSTTTYIIKSTYAKWDDANVDVFGTDTIRVSQNTTLPPITENISPAPCGINTTGTITITSPVGPSIKYTVSDGTITTSQTSTIITQKPGIYTVTARDTLTGCTGVKTITINTATTLTATATLLPAACVGSSSGKITVNATLGSAPYKYALDGNTQQVSNVFNNVIAGNHTIQVTDNLGCVFNFAVIVGSGAGFNGTTSNVKATCPGATNGTLSVISLTGVSPYTFTLGTIVQVNNNTFTGLAAGSYTIKVVDAAGCIKNIAGSVGSGTGFTTTATTVNAACSGSASGKITVIVPTTNGTAPFQYLIDTSAVSNSYQGSNVFNNIAAGNYNVTVKDAIGCSFTFPVSVANSSGVSGTARITNAACLGTATGKIVFIPLAGVSPFNYSIDSGRTYQALDTFKNIASGIYRLAIRDFNGCIYRFTVSVGNLSGSTATATTINAACNGSASGKIIFAPGVGTRPFTYSIDSGRTYIALDTFKNVLSGPYYLAAKDSNGCTYRFTINVGFNNGSTASALSINAACNGSATGKIIFTPGVGVLPFTYSIDSGLTFQPIDTFRNVASGTYQLVAKDANGCIYRFTTVVSNNVGATAIYNSINAACNGSASGKIIINPVLGANPFKYSIDSGRTYQTIDTFYNLASGSYNLAVKDANGCTYNFTGNVGNNIGATATSTSINAACNGSSSGRIIITPLLGNGPFRYSIDSGRTYQTIDTFYNLASGAYNLAVKDFTGCIYHYTGTIGNNIGATATATSINAACSGSATGRIIIKPLLGNPPFTFSKDSGRIFQAIDTFYNLASGNYNLAVKDANGCKYYFTGTVSNSIGTTATARTINAACNGSATGQVIVTPTLGTAPFTYSKDSGRIYQTIDTFKNVAGGVYNMAVKDSNGCIYHFTTTVNNSIGVTATASTINSACATAATGKIVVKPIFGTAPFKYSVDSILFQTNDTLINLAANTYTVYIVDANNCTFKLTAIVGNNIGTVATNKTLNTACIGSPTGTIIITPTVGTAPFEFLIDTAIVNTYQAVNIFRNMAAGNYNMAVRDANLCVFNFTTTVSNNIGVRADSIIDKASCAIIPNGKITIVPTKGIAPFMYQLNSNGYQTSNEFAALFSGNFTVTVKDSAGCLLNMNIVVGNAARVVLDSVNIIRPTCNGLSNGTIAVYPRLGVPPYTYAINSSSYQASNIFTNRAASVSDTLHIRDNSGCVKDSIITITEPTVLSINTASVPATCTGNADGSIKITSIGGTAPYEYTLDPTKISGYQSNPIFPLVIGTYTLSTKDAKGCIATKKDSVLLNDTMRLELGPDTTLCIGKTITFKTQSNNQTTTFKWSPSSYLNDSLFKNPTASPNDTIKYYLHATWGICSRKDSIVVNVLLKPTANAGNDTAICFKTAGVLYGSTGKVSGAVKFLWSPSTFLSNPTALTTICKPDTTGSYRYFLTVEDNYGCGFKTTDSVRITMQPLVPAFAGNDTNAVMGRPHQLLATGGTQYSWWPIGPLNYANIANPLATININTNFIVTVTDVAGCVGVDTVLLRAYRGPTYHCPNAFTPNGNGANDRFRPLPVGIKSTEYFRIFNRYGQLVFETNVYEGQFLKGWDGTYKGKLQDSGAYVWTIKGTDEKNKAVLMSGTVMLLR